MSPPIPDYNIHLFIGWLLQRNLSSDTINSYLSAIRQLYIKEGLDPSHIRSELIKQIIKGRSHQTLSTTTSGGSKPRLPVTPAVLRLMKEDIRTSDFEGGKKVLLWSVCTIAFAGAFRVHELLARNHAKFNPLDTLLGKDIKLSKCTLDAKTVTFLQITINKRKLTALSPRQSSTYSKHRAKSVQSQPSRNSSYLLPLPKTTFQLSASQTEELSQVAI